jgi:hypothetical protein
LYRYFAVTEDPTLLEKHGPHYRGFYCPIHGRNLLPTYLSQHFFKPFDDLSENTASFEEMVAFDDLIYLRYSTCSDPIACVVTYAHELQHFVQNGRVPRLLRVNNALYHNVKQFEPNATPIDIPSEREANIFSKRVSVAMFGADRIREFADKQVKKMEEFGAVEESTRWMFFRDVQPSTSYDLLESTMPFVQRYKGVIDFGIDVDKPS